VRVLVTGGGCEEAIDGVRFVANFSTGRTAARIAEGLLAGGHDVTLLAGLRAMRPAAPDRVHAGPSLAGALETVTFRSFADLDAALGKALNPAQGPSPGDSRKASRETPPRRPRPEPYGLIVHAAAVSDYSVASVETGGETLAPGTAGKITAEGELTVRMKPNAKLVDTLRSRAEGSPVIVAFKLTNGQVDSGRRDAAARLLERSGADYVVSNDLSEIDGEAHPFRVYRAARALGAGAEVAAGGRTLDELARFIRGLADMNRGGKET